MVATYVPGPHGPMVFASTGGAATTWDPVNKGTLASLSAGNLVWANTANNFTNVRSLAHLISNQKAYFEVVAVVASGSANFVGICDVAANLDAGIAGANLSPTHAGVIHPTGAFLCQDSVNNLVSCLFSGPANGDNIGVAFDSSTGKIWFRKNGGAWNEAIATQDPATGAGGLSIPFAGFYYALDGSNGVINDGGTAKFLASSWTYAAPSGFTQIAA